MDALVSWMISVFGVENAAFILGFLTVFVGGGICLALFVLGVSKL
jgi:hypothetical protein